MLCSRIYWHVLFVVLFLVACDVTRHPLFILRCASNSLRLFTIFTRHFIAGHFEAFTDMSILCKRWLPHYDACGFGATVLLYSIWLFCNEGRAE